MAQSNAVQTPAREKTKFGTGVAYAFGSIGEQLSWALISSYLTIFYTDILGLSAGAISLIFVIARIWDAANDPMMGAIADRTHTRFGKFRPYLIFVAPVLALFNVLTFTAFPLEGTAKVVVTLLCYIGAGMSYTAVDVSYGSLVNMIARDSQVRMNYTSYRAIGTGIIQMILSATVMPMVLYFGKSDAPTAGGYFKTAVVLSILMIPCLWICAGVCKETVHVNSAAKASKQVPVKESFKVLLKNKYLMVTVFAVFAGAVGAIARMSMLSYYVIYDMGSPAMIATVFTTMTACQLIGNFTLPWGTKTFGKKGYLVITSFIQAGLMIVMFFIPATNTTSVLILSAAIGLSMCNANVCTGMLSDCIEYGDWKFGVRVEGLTFSFMSFGVKLATAVTGVLTVNMLNWVGYVPNAEQTAGAKQGINAIVNLFPAAVIIISTLAVVFIYNLDKKKLDKIYADLDERKAKEEAAGTVQ